MGVSAGTLHLPSLTESKSDEYRQEWNQEIKHPLLSPISTPPHIPSLPPIHISSHSSDSEMVLEIADSDVLAI